MAGKPASDQRYAGLRFGRLVVLRRAPPGGPTRKWVCRCDCGAERNINIASLKKGVTVSCGCLALERRTKHGRSRSPTYSSWRAMRARCQRPSSVGFASYGGRGISVCERWEKFENFLADMGERPLGTSIDRIDVNGNYEPGNCRWATREVQDENVRPRGGRLLTEVDVQKIYAARKPGKRGAAKVLAARYGVSRQLVSGIWHGRLWSRVTNHSLNVGASQ